MRLVIELFWVKIRSVTGETDVYELHWNIWFHFGKKRRWECNLRAYLWVMITYELLNGNIVFYELISIYCVQLLMWSVTFAFIGLSNAYEKWGVYWIKHSENLTTQVQVMPSWTPMYFSWPLTFINRFKVYRICVLGQSRVSNFILNMVTLLIALNLYR